jgi:hypothetical protein
MITVIGFKDKAPEGITVINTTSRSTNWSAGLSPFYLGPVRIPFGNIVGGIVVKNVENAWQFSKVYSEHIGPDGEPTEEYYVWAAKGFKDTYAHRYPMGKGKVPKYSLWKGEHLSYIEARKKIYIPLYYNAVVETDAYKKLEKLHKKEKHLALWDFDGYDHKRMGLTYKDVREHLQRKMGHAFVLAMMLEGKLPDRYKELEKLK